VVRKHLFLGNYWVKVLPGPEKVYSSLNSSAGMEGYRNKSRFLYGESMGGAVALLLHRKDPTFWDGAVLVAPMCKVLFHTEPD
jgi:alpha-beta hydrolase superfamily lysophospholipase